MTAVTKAAFIVSLAKTHGITRQAAQEAANAVVATLAQTLIDGHDITPPRLGGFSRKEGDPGGTHHPVQGGQQQIQQPE